MNNVTVETAQQQAEREKRLYETVINNTPDLIYVFGLDYRFTYANKALLDMWGSTWEKSIGKSLLENGYEPWHAEMHEREIDEVVRTKKSIRGEVSFPHATLGKRVYDYILVPVINHAGQVEAIAGTTRDITDLRVSTENVAESEARFRKLADESPMFVFIIDKDPTAPVSYWNKTWLDYTGQSLEDALGRSWNGVIHPDDNPIVMQQYVPAFEAHTSYLIPAVRVLRHDGEYRWHTFKGNPRQLPNGDFNGYVGVGLDIHEQKLAEDALKQSEVQLQQKVAERTEALQNQKALLDNILRNSSNGISVSEVVRNEHGEIIDAKTILANDAAIKFVGLPKDIYLGKTAVELDPEILASPYGQTCLKTLATGEPSLIQYNLAITGRWLELTISKMDDEHLIHIFTDVTPIKEAQLQLEHTIEELKRSNANLEEFAYAASHDLKEPIRKIRTFSDRLKSRIQPKLLDDDQHYFERMEKATARMQSLIDDLLAYSHVSASDVYSGEIDLNKKVTNVLEDLDELIADKQAVIVRDPLPTIKGNRRQLQQLFQNLLANSLKFSKPGVSARIHISADVVSGQQIKLPDLTEEYKNKSYHLIQISDNGIGFEQEYADKIFKMFQRLHQRDEYEGTGIGLAIVRKVVENHKGFITAESEPGNGATFKVYLPVE
jgi:PAS domain S-box-containing protein